MKPACGESCPSGQCRRSAVPGRIRSHPLIRNPSICLQLRRPHWLIADWLGPIKLVRGESRPSGQRRHPWRIRSQPRKIVPNIYKANNPGKKMEIPRVNTDPHGQKTPNDWLIPDWLGFMEPARGKSCSSGQRRGRATHGGDKVPSPDQKPFHISVTPTTWGRKRRSPGSIPPHTVWKPQPR